MKVEEYTLTLIEEAQKKGCSDLHILPEGKEYIVYFRTGEIMQLKKRLTTEEGERLISYLKFISNMNVGERRKPQSGSAQIEIDSKLCMLRFSTITNFRSQESMVVRILSQSKNYRLDETTYFQEEVAAIKKLSSYKSGLMVFSGPVDSGKTTSMYQLIRENNMKMKQQVITIEDPVEIEEPSFLQAQVNEKAGISYAALLKQSLRHHPDVLVIGEIRDEETAKMAIRGALTGHLIIANIHAKDTTGVLDRFIELGVSKQQLQQTLLGVIYQKLLPRYCPLCQSNCKQECNHYSTDQKRAVLYEVLAGKQLESVLVSNEPQIKRKRSFNHLLRKAAVYGFISEQSVKKYQIPEFEESTNTSRLFNEVVFFDK